MNQWLIYGFYTHVNVICKALACQNVCSFFVVCVCAFFGLRPSMATKETKNLPKKRGSWSPCHEVPLRGSSAMEPWEAPLRGWSSSFGGMARSGEHRRWEMGVEWIDVLIALLANKNDPKTKTNILYRWNVFFSFSGDGQERNTIRTYSTSWVWFFQKKQSL